MNIKPSGTGESPLANITEWVNVVDPVTGKKGRRETNTMPQWAGSCWYYLRYIDPNNDRSISDPELSKTLVASRYLYWRGRARSTSLTICTFLA